VVENKGQSADKVGMPSLALKFFPPVNGFPHDHSHEFFFQGPMMATTLLSDWSWFSATHVGVAHFTEGYVPLRSMNRLAGEMI